MSRLTDRSRRQSLLARWGALSLLGAVLLFVAGLRGLLLAGGVAIAWTVLPTVYTFAGGQLLYAGLVADAVAPGPVFVLGGAAAFGVLFAADIALQWPRRTTGVSLLAFVAAGAAIAGVSLAEPAWGGALAAFGVFALGAYSVHRYELVALGLLGEAES